MSYFLQELIVISAGCPSVFIFQCVEIIKKTFLVDSKIFVMRKLFFKLLFLLTISNNGTHRLYEKIWIFSHVLVASNRRKKIGIKNEDIT